MIDSHCCCQRKHLPAHQGLSALQIARELTLEPRTVAYWLTQEHCRPRTPRQRSSTLAPFQPEIGRLLDREPYAAPRSFSACVKTAVMGAIPWAKPMSAPSDPDGSPPCSPWPWPRARVPRLIGACLALCQWHKRSAGCASV